MQFVHNVISRQDGDIWSMWGTCDAATRWCDVTVAYCLHPGEPATVILDYCPASATSKSDSCYKATEMMMHIARILKMYAKLFFANIFLSLEFWFKDIEIRIFIIFVSFDVNICI